MSSRQVLITAELHRYVLENSIREPEVLARLRAETANLPHASMQIGPEQGQLMALLAKLIGAKECIEVGVFTGYSALAVALALPEDGKIVACDVSEEWTAITRRYWKEGGVEHKIDLRLQRAVRTLDGLIDAGEGGSYDYAFIDADKPSYDAYYERVFKLLRPGGLMLIDNVLWSGKVAEPALKPETIRTYELVCEQYFGQHYRINVSAYSYRVADLISQAATEAGDLEDRSFKQPVLRASRFEFGCG